MLAIHRRLFDRMKNVKAITAGAIAFGVGLTAAAAYVGATTVYDNFAYEMADKKASAKVAGASTAAEIKAENGETGVPGSGSSSSSTPVMGQSTATGVSVAPTTSGATTLVPGRGSGSTTPTVTVAPAPAPAPTEVIVVPSVPDTETCPCGVLNTVETTVDGVVDGLGL